MGQRGQLYISEGLQVTSWGVNAHLPRDGKLGFRGYRGGSRDCQLEKVPICHLDKLLGIQCGEAISPKALLGTKRSQAVPD